MSAPHSAAVASPVGAASANTAHRLAVRGVEDTGGARGWDLRAGGHGVGAGGRAFLLQDDEILLLEQQVVLEFARGSSAAPRPPR